MRGLAVLPLVLGVTAGLGACSTQSDDDDVISPGGGWGEGSGGYGGGTQSWCESDTDCATSNLGSGAVCARDGECLLAADVHIIHVTWTVSGQPASATSCVNAPDLELSFFADPSDYDYEFGFAPVPCAEGKFTIDKMPISYTSIQLLRDMDDQGGAQGMFDGSGDVALDLPY